MDAIRARITLDRVTKPRPDEKRRRIFKSSEWDLEEPAAFQQYINRLTGTARNFFENEFKDKSFFQTRKQILRRLYGILSNPVFEPMFSQPRELAQILLDAAGE